ncbi:hypothetical protein [Halopiger aswanensis]|uniref:Uncharacterized protein n=1 Tax=Halopiger aswanensis TaxID=148449 RepID=A0A3R7HUU8_9EURY|nr:hypothetical protein [Halopiger aswanensis]RKD85213.1 hypothetical protein ATJ93_4769 [Halopiger aswanensis]
MPTNNGMNHSRRSVLQAASAGSSLLIFSEFAKASPPDGKVRYSGLSYDTKTHIEQAESTGELEVFGEKIEGVLKVAGFELPFGKDTWNGIDLNNTKKLEPKGERGHLTSYEFVRDEERYLKDGLPLQVEFDTDYVNIVGTITRPSPEYSHLSFTLKSESENGSPEQVRGALPDNEIQIMSSIPEEGIPKSTSIIQTDDIKNINSGTSDITIQSSDDFDGEDIGIVDEESNYGSSVYDSEDDALPNCPEDTTVVNGYRYNIAYSTLSIGDYDPDQLPENNSRRVFLHGFFENMPTNLIDEDECSVAGDYNYPAPVGVNYSVRTSNTEEADIGDMYPKEENGDSGLNDWVEMGLNVVDELSDTWGSVATTSAKFVLDSGDTSDLETDEIEGHVSRELTWSFNLDNNNPGIENFPSDRSETSIVSFDVKHGAALSNGDTTDIDIESEYIFRYPSHDSFCPCEYTFINDSVSVSSTVELTVD